MKQPLHTFSFHNKTLYNMKLLFLVSLFTATGAFAPLPSSPRLLSTPSATLLSATATPVVTDYVKDLMEHLDGKRLLESSSDSWRKAIFEAVGAPATADEAVVAKALGDAMARPDNQFALLMTDSFVATFPSDPVDYEDGTCWVECQLRDKQSDQLLVDMGVQLVAGANGQWLISSLDWQDFRDEFYPGLSGREWLRAF